MYVQVYSIGYGVSILVLAKDIKANLQQLGGHKLAAFEHPSNCLTLAKKLEPEATKTNEACDF